MTGASTAAQAFGTAARWGGRAVSIGGGSIGGGSDETFQDMSSNIAVASSGFNNLIEIVCWVCGAGLGVTAIFKIKQHVDSGGHTPMKDGLIRLGAAGALLAFPFIEQAMQGSISNGSLAHVAASTMIMDTTLAFQ